MIGLRLDGMKKFKALKLVQFFPNFLLDEFFFRVGGFIHGENMKRHLVLSVNIANECDTVATHNDLQFHLMNTHCQLSVATSPLPLVSSWVFLFSSRRRHTISLCDWSSDVCSSD